MNIAVCYIGRPHNDVTTFRFFLLINIDDTFNKTDFGFTQDDFTRPPDIADCGKGQYELYQL